MSSRFGRLTRGIAKESQPRQLLSSLAAGVVAGVIGVTIAAAFGTLVFSGKLSSHVSAGIGLMLFSTAVIAALAALTTSLRGLVAGLQDSAIAILALVSTAIAESMPSSATAQERFLTVAAAIALTSCSTGIAFFLLGQFKLANLIRFIPYPVIGGFLAGSGVLLATGALSVMTDSPISLTQLSPLVQPSLLARWLPGLVLAVTLLAIARRSANPLLVPGTLLAGIAAFYVVLWLSGTPASAAVEHGWLLSSMPEGGGQLWQPLKPSDLALVNWAAVGAQVPSLLAVSVVSIISTLLCATGVELSTGQDADLNHELKAIGISTVASGLGGGAIGTHIVGDTALVHKMGAKGRLVGLFLAAVCAVVLLFGGSIVSLFPTPILGGLLLFLGLDFLVMWVYDAWFKLPLTDYAVVILIAIVISTVGFLEGVGLGTALTILLFVVNYSRVDIVRHALTGESFASNVDRPRLYQQLLHQKGHWIYVLELQGFIFFGTATRLLDRVRQRLEPPDARPPHFVVMDFRLVSGLDSSAILSFAKMMQMTKAHNATMVFTHLTPKMHRQMEKELFQDENSAAWRVFPDLDHGIEWCEEQMIDTFESVGFGARPETLMKLLEKALPAENVDTLLGFFERLNVGQGHCVIRQGDTHDGLYFVEEGQLTATLDCGDDRTVRLRTMRAGTVIGELGLYLQRTATASVVADETSTLFYLSADRLRQMEDEAPEIATPFHRFVIHVLSERLAGMNDTIQALLK
jgi:SulP family sulfate permease